jgi:hypothetical protein
VPEGVVALVQQVAKAIPQLKNLTIVREKLQAGADAAAATAAEVQASLQKALGSLGKDKPGVVVAQVKAELAFKQVGVMLRCVFVMAQCVCV